MYINHYITVHSHMGLYEVKTAVLKYIPLSNGKGTKITAELVEQWVNHEWKQYYVFMSMRALSDVECNIKSNFSWKNRSFMLYWFCINLYGPNGIAIISKNPCININAKVGKYLPEML